MTLTTYRLDRENADRLLVLLHGWSAEEHHLAAYVPLVDPDERFTAIAPRAPQIAEGTDGYAWFGIGGEDPEGFRAAVTMVDELIDSTCAEKGIPRERTVLAGFSQGGFLSLAVANQAGAKPLAGVWAMCCATPFDALEYDLAGASRPALVQVGEKDEIIAPERGREAAEWLKGGGWDVTVAGYDMAHSQTIEMMADARTWLTTVLP